MERARRDVTGGTGKTPEYVGYYYPTGTSLGPVEVGGDGALGLALGFRVLSLGFRIKGFRNKA